MIFVIKNTLFPSNTYIVSEGRYCIVIDPGLDANLIVDTLKKRELIPLAVMSTHGHFDHIFSLNDLIQEYNPEIYIHKDDHHNSDLTQ